MVMAMHDIPYVATATLSHLEDYAKKLVKAKEKAKEGFAYLHVFCPCVVGWKTPTDASIEVCRDAVRTNYFPLWEMEDGVYRITQKVKDPRPVGRADLDHRQVPAPQGGRTGGPAGAGGSRASGCCRPSAPASLSPADRGSPYRGSAPLAPVFPSYVLVFEPVAGGEEDERPVHPVHHQGAVRHSGGDEHRA